MFSVHYSFYTVPPLIDNHPNKNITLYEDFTSVNLTCMAHGASSYNWKRKNGNISSTAEGINSKTLSLHNVSAKDSGDYWCEAKNRNGIVSSNFFRLTIEGKYLCMYIAAI